jgi:hypothetical protein
MFDLRNAMVDLERSFADWRWQMLAAGLRTPELVEELELHLREEVEQQMRFGADPLEAFAAAVARMGSPVVLQREFRKIGLWGARFWWVLLGIGSFGLVQTAMLNLVGPMIFHRHASVFLSPKWWADWFPSYLVWVSFTVAGAAIGWAGWRAQRKAARQ